MERYYNYTFLLIKLVMAIMVVGIHSFSLSRIQNFGEFVIFQGISRLAVPVFFLISAYLLFLKKSYNREILKRYVKRIALLMLFWTVVTLPYVLYLQILVPYRMNFNLGLTLEMFLKQTLLSPRFNGFWYLYACIICATLIFALDKLINNKFLMFISCIMQIICILTSAYGILLPKTIQDILISLNENVVVYNSFFVGMIYFVIGKYIAETEKERLFAYQFRKPGLAISLVLLLLEILYVYKNLTYLATDCYFMLAPTAYFIILNSLDSKIKEVKFAKYFSAATTVVYILQFAVLYILQGVEKRLPFEVSTWVIYIYALIGTLMITGILKYVERYLKFFKYMY